MSNKQCKPYKVEAVKLRAEAVDELREVLAMLCSLDITCFVACPICKKYRRVTTKAIVSKCKYCLAPEYEIRFKYLNECERFLKRC